MCLGFVIDDSLPRLDGASVVMCAVCVFIYVCVYIRGTCRHVCRVLRARVYIFLVAFACV